MDTATWEVSVVGLAGFATGVATRNWRPALILPAVPFLLLAPFLAVDFIVPPALGGVAVGLISSLVANWHLPRRTAVLLGVLAMLLFIAGVAPAFGPNDA